MGMSGRSSVKPSSAHVVAMEQQTKQPGSALVHAVSTRPEAVDHREHASQTKRVGGGCVASTRPEG
eukprot:14713018-Alexandrium_andersonii.AAC.1